MKKPPVVARPKKTEPRINHRIRVPEVRVIGVEGDQLGILRTEEALARANEAGLDLVEVSPMSRPPVCKIMDYGKFKYTTKKKAVEQRKNQKVVEVKEVKFRPKTDTHDVEIKVNRAREFIDEGNKVKATIMFRGREITHPEIGQQILDKVAKQLEDIASIEFMPRMEGRSMFMILAPGKASARPRPAVPAAAPAGAPAPAAAGAAAPAAPAAAAPRAETPAKVEPQAGAGQGDVAG
jgi:translation initiation factor IF-3